MQSNHQKTLKTLQDTLASGIAEGVNKATLKAFKMTNDKLRQEEGIDKIPIYKNVRLTRATGNRQYSRLWIYDKVMTKQELYRPTQTATGITFLRPVKLGGKVITSVASAFIPKNLRRVSDNKNAFKRVGKSRLPIVKLKSSTLFDYYSFQTVQQRLVSNFDYVMVNEVATGIANQMSRV